MANFRSICIISFFLTLIFHLSNALFEDQIGKFDWRRSYIGKVKYVHFEAKRIIVTTEENVLASLNLKNGNIQWRQILEDPKDQQIQLLYVDKDILTVSGSKTSWLIRSWELTTGTLLSEWTLNLDKTTTSEFIVSGNSLVHVALEPNSHIQVTGYDLLTGEKQNATKQIPAPWIGDTSRCVIANDNYVCLSSDDSSGQLYYVNLLSVENKLNSKPVQSLIGHGSGRVFIIDYKLKTPSVLLSRNNVAKLVILKNDVEVKPFDLIPNAVSIDGTVIYQLEASDNPDKLIRVKSKNFETGNDDFSVDLDYPLGLGAPIILGAQFKEPVTDLLLSTTDSALLLVRLPEGKILWTREEALSNIVATEFFELPVSDLDASIEREFDDTSDIFGMFVHRITTQARQLYSLIFGGQLLSGNGLVRDEFGLHQIIVVATRIGKLFAIDTLSGSIAWSYRLPNVRPFKALDSEKMILLVQRTARYAPLPAQATLLAEDALTGNGVIFQFNPITGYSDTGIQRLDYRIVQAMLMPQHDENYLKPFVVLSGKNDAYIYPSNATSLIKDHFSTTYMYTIDEKTGRLKGFNFKYSTESVLKVFPAWDVNISPSKLVATSVKPPNERVHSQGRVLYDRSVYYKYVNPNLIALATISDDPLHKHVLSIYLIDGVTGLVLYSNSHKKANGPILLVHSENWLVYSYYSERFRRTEVAAAEMYEGHVQSNSTVFSSHAVSQLPHVQTQSYILPAYPTKMAVTLTERGITNKFLLVGLSNGWVVEIPWLLLQPRFDDIPCGPEESCIPYMPEIPLPSDAVINYNQTLGRVKGVEVAPARLESTSHILVHGLDIFYTRVAPSKTFDVLKEDFDHHLIVLVLIGLIVASYVTKQLASRKALKQAWK